MIVLNKDLYITEIVFGEIGSIKFDLFVGVYAVSASKTSTNFLPCLARSFASVASPEG